MKNSSTHYVIEKRIRGDKEWFDRREYSDITKVREDYNKFVKETIEDKLSWATEYRLKKVTETVLFSDKIEEVK